MKRLLPLLLALLLTGCGAPDPSAPPAVPEADAPQAVPARHFALIVKRVENPYMLAMYDGFSEACGALGVRATLHGPAESGKTDQTQYIEALLAGGCDAIAIAANDMEEVSGALARARAQGVTVVSLDSVVEPGARDVHIQQASPESIGRVLVQAGAQILENEGEFAILTTTDAMPNQAGWVRWMCKELEKPQYGDMRLVEVAYGMDESGASYEATQRLLAEYPGLRLIVAPTTVGMRAAAEAIQDAGAPVALTGLGLPSEMEPFILSGMCPFMYLWSPVELGYLAACAMDAFQSGTVSGETGEVMTAGHLGEKVIAQSEDGGREIVLGSPRVFDRGNIAVWAELF